MSTFSQNFSAPQSSARFKPLSVDSTSRLIAACISGEMSEQILGLFEERAELLHAITNQNQSGVKTFENTILPLVYENSRISLIDALLDLLGAIAPSELRSKALDAPLPRPLPALPSSELLYKAVAEFLASDAGKSLEQSAKLAAEKIHDTYAPDSPLEAGSLRAIRLKSIRLELDSIACEYRENSTKPRPEAFVHVTELSKLRGLSQQALEGAAEEAAKRGLSGWCLAYDNWTSWEWSTRLAVRETREAMFKMCLTADAADNLPLVARMLRLRNERAVMHGFKSTVEFENKTGSIKTAEGVERLLSTLEEKTRLQAKQELEGLTPFAKDQGISEIKMWDVSFLRAQKRTADRAKIDYLNGAYFSTQGVLKELFHLSRELFGVEIRTSNLPVWHSEVTSHEVVDRDGTLLGHFYLDLYAREAKRDIRSRLTILFQNTTTQSEPIGHLCALLSSFNQPNSNQSGGDPKITHSEMVTLFHEFGHLLHLMLGKARLPHESLGASLELIEIPSHFFENLAYDQAVLRRLEVAADKKLRTHFDEFISEIENQRRTEILPDFRTILGASFIDNALHASPPFSSGEALVECAQGQDLRVRLVWPQPKMTTLTGNLTLWGDQRGYGGTYVSYVLSELWAFDLYSEYKRSGLNLADFGNRFRKAFLESAESSDVALLLQNTLGRLPNTEPFITYLSG